MLLLPGNVYVYSLSGNYQSHDPLSDGYCNSNLYLFAFWVITFQYILCSVFILFCCCVCCTVCSMADKRSKDERRQARLFQQMMYEG